MERELAIMVLDPARRVSRIGNVLTRVPTPKTGCGGLQTCCCADIVFGFSSLVYKCRFLGQEMN